MLTEYEMEIRVRYHETDGQGHVHHANYFHYFELGRTEMLRAAGHEYAEMERQGLFLVVAGISCQYLRPCEFGETLTLRIRVTQATGARVLHEYELLRDGERLATGRSTVACVDGEGRVRRLPGWLKGES